jgi:hypothetical protein
MAIAEVKAVLVHVLHRYTIRPNAKAIPPMPISLLTFKPHQVLVDLDREQQLVTVFILMRVFKKLTVY